MKEEMWNKLGKNFKMDDNIFFTPQGFIFSFNEVEDVFESEVQYNDYDNKNGLDNLIDELENILIEKGVEYNIIFTSFCYLIKIGIN